MSKKQPLLLLVSHQKKRRPPWYVYYYATCRYVSVLLGVLSVCLLLVYCTALGARGRNCYVAFLFCNDRREQQQQEQASSSSLLFYFSEKSASPVIKTDKDSVSHTIALLKSLNRTYCQLTFNREEDVSTSTDKEYLDNEENIEMWLLKQKRSASQHSMLPLYGGQWLPVNCRPLDRVAIVVPYRERANNLRHFLQHMHPFLQRQQLYYGIYLVEPTIAATTPTEGDLTSVEFNRGLLMNIGFVEALKDNANWDCFIFHDVDLLPLNQRNLYYCPPQTSPRHMSSAVSTFDYKLPYETIFGGVTAFTKKQFQEVNGFSNLYFGWGNEDDDLFERVIAKFKTILRYPLDIGRYLMLKHDKEMHFNDYIRKFLVYLNNRNFLFHNSKLRQDKEGLNTLQYNVKSVSKSQLYTKILVSYDKNEIVTRKY